jgi:hypothetical protein
MKAGEGDRAGFDAVVGNPPYGQNTAGPRLRRLLRASWDPSVLAKKSEGGSYNLSAIFVERAGALLRRLGQLGLIANASIARVDEFRRTRELLSSELQLRELVDEGNPFERSGVTLEMITLLAAKRESGEEYVRVASRRRGERFSGRVSAAALEADGRFVIYRDEIYEHLRRTCRFGALHGTRGRDAPRRDEPAGEFTVPYYHSGKTIQKYRTVYGQLDYAPESLLEKESWRKEYDSEALLATKIADRYRVTLKPPGSLAGNNCVRLAQEGAVLSRIALVGVLNSELMDRVVRRYLLNCSELTMAFYDSVTMATPLPRLTGAQEKAIGGLASYLILLRGSEGGKLASRAGELLDLAIYEAYFGEGYEALSAAISDKLRSVGAAEACYLRAEREGDGLVPGRLRELERVEENGMSEIRASLEAMEGYPELRKRAEAIAGHRWVRVIRGERETEPL